VELELSLWAGPSVLAARASVMRVPRHKTAIANTTKLFVWAGSSFETFGTPWHTKRQIKLEEMFDKGATSHAWTGMKCFAFQCFWLFY
jgi:hypothetical protein